MRTKGLLLPLLADRRRLAVPGVDPGLGRQLHQLVHHRGLAGPRSRSRPGARVPPTVPLKSTSAVRQSVPSKSSAQVVGAVAGRVDRLDPQVAGLDHVAVGDRLVDLVVDQLVGELVGEDRHAEAVGELAGADDVVVVVVGEQQVGDLDALALGALGERVGDRVRVDEHALAAGLVDDEVGVREPVRLFDSLQDQRFLLSRLVELDHAADPVLGLHQLEAAVDVVERDPVRDERVDVDLAGEVAVDQLRARRRGP